MILSGVRGNSCMFVRFKRGSRGSEIALRARSKDAFSSGLEHFIGKAYTGKKGPMLFGSVIHHGFPPPGNIARVGNDCRGRNPMLISARKGCLRSPHQMTKRVGMSFVSLGGLVRSLIANVKIRGSEGLFV